MRSPYNTNASILVIAGGGGGSDVSGLGDGLVSNNGGPNKNGVIATNGEGGRNTNQTTMGGAGFFGNSVYSVTGTTVGWTAAKSFVNGGTGGIASQTFTATTPTLGGFGGGGASARGAEFNPNGGGGGYSGGGDGYNSEAGGGGSFNSGTNQTNIQGSNSGNGYVKITFSSVV